MKKVIRALALAAVLAGVPAAASATVVQKAAVVQKKPAACSAVNDCYYRGTVILSDGAYDVYECYSNGDGSY